MAEWRLELAEEARLYFRGRRVPVRRRGLAILVLVALGFEARRERVAGMLWNHGHALNNLRVELHELRRFFPGWAQGKDPLFLPEELEVAESARPLLSNLRGITTALDAWLDALAEGASAPEPGLGLTRLTPPFVLFVRPLPLTDEERVLREIAEAAGLPLAQGGRGLGVMRAGYDFDARVVLQNPRRSWVIFLPPYGEDPVDMLELRARLPAERVRYLELAPWGWWEARDRMLTALPFTEAARVYLAAGGQPGHMAELLALRPEAGFGERLPMPQRVRAVYRRESRFLSLEGRIALERLSVHPGRIVPELLAAFGFEEVVEELERKRWLVFRDEGWVFRHEAGRRVLAAGMEEGRRRLYHRRMAEVFDALGEPFAAAYHARSAGLPWRGPGTARGWARVVLEGGGQPVMAEETPRGGELLIEGFELEAGAAQVRGDRLAFVRTPSTSGASVVAFETPEVTTLVRVRGRAWVRNALEVGLDGDAAPLFLRSNGRRMVFAPVKAPRFADGEWVVPIATEFEHWVRFPPGQRVRLGSRAESAVIELRLDFYRADGVHGEGRVRAFAFDAAPVSEGQRIA